jgi:hypothetical protein
MTRFIPSTRYSFCPIPVRQRLTDHGIFSIIAKTALRNSSRIIELQTPHFANRSESHTCKLPGGIGPNSLQIVRMISRPSLGRCARMAEDSVTRAAKNLALGPVTTTRRRRRSAGMGAKTMLLRPTASSPCHRVLFWTSQRTPLYIRLLFGRRCFLHVAFSHTKSGLAAVIAASGLFSAEGCGLYFESAQYGCGLYLEPVQ